MAGGRWTRVLLLAAAAAAGVAACSSPPHHPSAVAATQSARAAVAARTADRQRAVQLRGALLVRINGVTAAAPAEYGSYASLPAVRAARQPPAGGSVTPKACAQVTLTGFDAALLAGAPAAAVTFRVGQNGISEVIVAPPVPAAARALASRLPAGCARYHAAIGGTTVRYTASESAVTGIGEQALVLNVQTAGHPADDAWTLVYRASGFAGAVIVVGPNASRLAVLELGQQAYAYAAKTLS